MFGFFKCFQKPEFTFTLKSNKGIDAIESRTAEVIDAYGFTLLHTYNYHEVLASKGFPIERKVYVYEVCQAQTAAMMLEINPDFAPFMPCRIAVYEKEDGVYIATQNMQPMLNSLDKESKLYRHANLLFDKLQEMLMELAV